MDKKELKEIEIRSEEEVMGKIPSWILRRGIAVLFGVVVVLLVGSAFFMLNKYKLFDMNFKLINFAII